MHVMLEEHIQNLKWILVHCSPAPTYLFCHAVKRCGVSVQLRCDWFLVVMAQEFQFHQLVLWSRAGLAGSRVSSADVPVEASQAAAC